MPLTENQRRQLETLRKKHRIQFDRRFSDTDLSREQLRIYENIRKLGGTRYDDYAIDPSHNYSNEPWKLEAKDLALNLTERADRCRRRNEATWRYACEPLIFARVNADVACPKCRQRLWRSEIESARDDNTREATALKKRQESRQPCRCPQTFRGIDHHEAKGVSRIFTHREEETCNLPATIAAELPKSYKPDRVYGLRETRNFDVALQKQARQGVAQDESAGDGKLVIDLIDVSTYSLDGDRLLFPFLFIEAKSGKSQDDWESIRLQTCFPIQAALGIQLGLRLGNVASSRWNAGPLVWFFMSKGEDWRLCFAFIKGNALNHQSVTYHILDVWSGSILTNDGALQLILIVDHIFDWARDIYRPDVLAKIRLLANDTSAVDVEPPDSEIFSTKDTGILRWTEDITAEAGTRETERITSIFHRAGPTASQFGMLLITRDNVDRLMKQTLDLRLAYQISTQILTEPLTIEIDTLYGIEEQWTGNIMSFRPLPRSSPKFSAVISIAARMTDSWVQIMALCVVAVAEDAFRSLVEYARIHTDSSRSKPPHSYPVDKETLIGEISRFRNASRFATLMRAIKKSEVRFRRLPERESGFGFVSIDGLFQGSLRTISASFKTFVSDSPGISIRNSERFEEVQTATLGSGDEYLEEIHDPNATAVLVHACNPRGDKQESTRPDVCVFLLRESLENPDNLTLARSLWYNFINSNVYHMLCNNRVSSIRTVSRIPSRNVEFINGKPTYGSAFIAWIDNLGPITQLWPRLPVGRSESGPYPLSRNPASPPDYNPGEGEEDCYRIYLSYRVTLGEFKTREEQLVS